MTVLEGPEGVAFFQLASRKGALSLENKGLRRSGRGMSVYDICKLEYGLTGTREEVLAGMQRLVDQAIANKAAERAASGGLTVRWNIYDEAGNLIADVSAAHNVTGEALVAQLVADSAVPGAAIAAIASH